MFSGADLEAIINESALAATMANKDFEKFFEENCSKRKGSSTDNLCVVVKKGF